MWKFILTLAGFLSLSTSVNAEATLNPNPLYDFANGCPGLIDIGLPPFVCKQESYAGDIFIISSLTHQVMKLAEDDDNWQCSVYGYLPIGPGGVNLGGSFSLGMTVDPSGDLYVSNTGTGPATTDFGSVWKIPAECPSNSTSPIEAVKIYTATSPFGLPSGLSFDWRHNALLLSSETDGTIYKIPLNGNPASTWLSYLDDPILAGTGGIPGINGDITNTNLFGAPFGPVASSISENGKEFYVGLADRGLLAKIKINSDGSAGALEIVSSSPQHTIEGVYYDSAKKTAYFGSVFRNGTNLTPNGPLGEYNGGVLPGNSVWIADLQEGTSTRFYDERLGAVCSTNDAKGVLRRGDTKILVVGSGFDFLPAWPLGLVRLGTQPYPSGGVDGSTTGPAFIIPYNAKLWVLNVD
jgi:hypothetical protein